MTRDAGWTEGLDDLVGAALTTGDDAALRAALLEHSRLPGPRANLELVAAVAGAVGAIVREPDPPVDVLEAMLDRWAALTPDEAPGDQPAVILPCTAVAAYGEVGAARPDWWRDEIAKLHRAATDTRWRVRELVAQALQRLLDADWPRTFDELLEWARDTDPFVVRAAVAAVAEPRLVGEPGHAEAAVVLQQRGVQSYLDHPVEGRRSDAMRALRQALGYTISVTTAATGDFGLLEQLAAAAADRDVRWIVRTNLGKARLRPWPEHVERLGGLL